MHVVICTVLLCVAVAYICGRFLLLELYSDERWTLTREIQSLTPGCGSWRCGLEQATHVQLLRSTPPMDYE